MLNANFTDTCTTLESFLDVLIFKNASSPEGGCVPITDESFMTLTVLWQDYIASKGPFMSPRSEIRRMMVLNGEKTSLFPTENQRRPVVKRFAVEV